MSLLLFLLLLFHVKFTYFIYGSPNNRGVRIIMVIDNRLVGLISNISYAQWVICILEENGVFKFLKFGVKKNPRQDFGIVLCD